MKIHQLIADHGAYFYLIVVVWTFLEGETVVLFAAFAAAQGLLRPEFLLIAAWARQLCRRSVLFLARTAVRPGCLTASRAFASGRRRRPALARTVQCRLYPDLPVHLRRAQLLVVRAGAQRGRAGSAFCGSTCWPRGCGRRPLSALGYFLGHAMRKALPDIARSFQLFMLAALVAVGAGHLAAAPYPAAATASAPAARRQGDRCRPATTDPGPTLGSRSRARALGRRARD